ncbi:DUF6167 family protein [Nocardioides marmoribigeumensis]|uniref:Secreted protein n=1 Tax=Nocardioides marmoribigeumensis TaxID=433649 RepID=A0ABU2BQW6_9ACTN|nr:DUF6167 family protein [Nocardioides marmoribigeumensis]MDR7361014.1 hypothetical protein [Nocardioides marmoribigeumensis]
MRTFWFVAGSAAGVYASTRTRRVAEALTVDGLHDRLTGWFAGARVLRAEFEAGRAEKQTELRERLALGPTGPRSGPQALTQGTSGSGESATVRVLPAARPR